MSFQQSLWRGLTGLLCGLALLGCQTAPAPALSPTATKKVTALQGLGFVRSDDGWELSLGVKLLFELDADLVSADGRRSLDEVARTLSQVGIDRVRVEGHTDNVGSAKYNRTLSMRRADSVAQQLVKGGWREASIERRGYGFDKPVADNSTADGRAQNRRVVVTVQVD